LTKEVPYETACELFEESTGLPVSEHTAHEVTQAVAEGVGVLDVAPTREEIAAKLAVVAAGPPWRPILLLAIDGADAPTRPETVKGRRRDREQLATAHAWQPASVGWSGWCLPASTLCWRVADRPHTR
jgi:hypothetical protein